MTPMYECLGSCVDDLGEGKDLLYLEVIRIFLNSYSTYDSGEQNEPEKKIMIK